MRTTTSVILLILALFVASPAFAQKPEGPSFLMAYQADGSLGESLDEPAGTPNSILKIDVSGIEHVDGFNDPDNTILMEFVGQDCIMTGIGWDVELTTVGASWLSEAVTYFDNVGQDGMGVFVTFGVGDNMPGTATYSSGGIIDLTDNGIPNLTFEVDGELWIQFFESFDDNPGAADSTYLPGSVYDIAGIDCGEPPTIDVPVLNPVGLTILVLLLATAGVFLVFRRARRLG